MTAVSAPLPVVILGGYLGAGKTTLLNRLLREADGRRIAVLVNDFGEIGIDADLIVSREGEVLNLSGGCICCALGGDLVEAVMTLTHRTPAIDLVLVETSGVALPGDVGRALKLAPGVALRSIVVLADARSAPVHAKDRYVGETVRRQIRDADLLIVNKVDLVDAGALAAVHDWLDDEAPGTPRLVAIDAEVPAESVLGIGARSAIAGAPRNRAASRSMGDRHSAGLFASACLQFAGPPDIGRLGTVLADPCYGVLRAKGVVAGEDGTARIVQAAGPGIRVTPAPHLPSRASTGRLVVIGLRGNLDADALSAALGARVLDGTRPSR